MITLNCEKGPVRIENWEDIRSRPGFVESLDHEEHQLGTVIGRYIFKEPIKCGLKGCRTEHNKGYLVATVSAHETNIGKDCGKKYFGIDFQEMTRQFDRDIEAYELRQSLWNFSFKIDDIEAIVADLRGGAKGADWIHRRLGPLVSSNGQCPEKIVRAVRDLVKNGTDIVKVDREATSEEHKQMETRQGKKLPSPQYVSESIGRLDGIAALESGNDLRQILILDLGENLRLFREKDIDQLSHRELQYWGKFVSQVDVLIERAEYAIDQGRKLLDAGNLSILRRLVSEKAEIMLFERFVKALNDR